VWYHRIGFKKILRVLWKHMDARGFRVEATTHSRRAGDADDDDGVGSLWQILVFLAIAS
jgi:hypothetical protein